eukprot:749376-Hanusia_phi.AAC.1
MVELSRSSVTTARTSSRENNTPPTGAPKATATPAAAALDMSSRKVRAAATAGNRKQAEACAWAPE